MYGLYVVNQLDISNIPPPISIGSPRQEIHLIY